MATKAKATSSSCLSFLKDALLLPTQNAKLFVPVFLLLTIPSFFLQITNVFCVQPLATGILLHINEIKNMDPSSPDYARLTAEILKEARELVIIAITVTIVSAVTAFGNQIVALFAGSTTYSGDRYSLAELFSEVIMKGRRLVGPLVTLAMAGALNIACALPLVALLQLVTRHLGGALPVAVFLFVVLPFLAFLYLDVVFTVAAAVSVADAERRGVSALRRAWRLMTATTPASSKEGCALAVVVHLLGMVPSPLYAAALGCLKKSVAMGLALLAVYALLSGLVQMFYFSAATVYYYRAMENKEVMARDHDYVKISNGEPSV